MKAPGDITTPVSISRMPLRIWSLSFVREQLKLTSLIPDEEYQKEITDES